MDNRDGTRSLLNRANKKLLVTFRAENQVKTFFLPDFLHLTFALSRTMTRLLHPCPQLPALARAPDP